VITQWQALLSGYGPTDLSALIPTILWWQTRTTEGIEAEAAAGDPAKQHLVSLGAPEAVRRDRTWVEAHADELETGITNPVW